MSLGILDFENFRSQSFSCKLEYSELLDVDKSIKKAAKQLIKGSTFKPLGQQKTTELIYLRLNGQATCLNPIQLKKVDEHLKTINENLDEKFNSHIDDAYSFYRLATLGTLRCKVLGPPSLREDKGMCRNFGELTTRSSSYNFRSTDTTPRSMTSHSASSSSLRASITPSPQPSNSSVESLRGPSPPSCMRSHSASADSLRASITPSPQASSSSVESLRGTSPPSSMRSHSASADSLEDSILPNFIEDSEKPSFMMSYSKEDAEVSEMLESQEETFHGSGAILNDSKWNIFKNDAAMLGAIHTCQTMYVAYSKAELFSLPDNDLYKDGNLRVLPRELIQLNAAGYKAIEVSSDESSYTLVCATPDKAITFTMNDMLESISFIRTAEAVRDRLRSIKEIPHANYVELC